MRSKLLFVVLFCAVLCTQMGCVVSMFRLAPAKQKIQVHNPNVGAVVLHDEDTVKTAHVKAPKGYGVDQIMLRQPGYKDRTYTFTLTKRSPLSALAVLNYIPYLFISKNLNDPTDPTLELNSKLQVLGLFTYWTWKDWRTPKMYRYNKHHELPKLEPIMERSNDERFIKVAWDTSRFLHTKFGSAKYYRMNPTPTRKDTTFLAYFLRADTSLIMNHLRYTNMKDVLGKFNYVDTVASVFNARGKSLILMPKFQQVLLNTIVTRVGAPIYDQRYGFKIIRSLTTHILWEIQDGFGQTLDSVRTEVTSDYLEWETKQYLADSICRDNLEFAFMKVQAYLRAKNLLKMDTAKKVFSPIFLEMPTPVANSVKDYYKSTVAVSTDDGHGSGVIVSKDGYIVSNWHLVVGKKEIEIILHNGNKLKAKVVRKADAEDLVLLKVDTTGLTPLLLANMEEPELGIDIIAIGTPHELELGQSASKGIISGLRKKEGLLYLQTDASLSGGNSGGPLIDKSGMVLGIISKKLVGVGVEGIGFALNAAHVFSALGIQYY